jgi:hypothetical protein
MQILSFLALKKRKMTVIDVGPAEVVGVTARASVVTALTDAVAMAIALARLLQPMVLTPAKPRMVEPIEANGNLPLITSAVVGRALLQGMVQALLIAIGVPARIDVGRLPPKLTLTSLAVMAPTYPMCSFCYYKKSTEIS